MNSLVDPLRVRIIQEATKPSTAGPVVYWMSRELRLQDNWALLRTIELSKESQQPLAVIYNLDRTFLGGTDRQYGFKLGALRELAKAAEAHGIAFTISTKPGMTGVIEFAKATGVTTIVADLTPLRIVQEWLTDLQAGFDGRIEQVDAHNIVPVWLASPKQEFAARTIRPKLQAALPYWLTNFPALPKLGTTLALPDDWKIDWSTLETNLIKDSHLFKPGEQAAKQQFKQFINRIDHYAEDRNDPTLNAISNLSPYLHYGMIAPQRVAYVVSHLKRSASTEAFLEELIIRRELADNFCFYNPNYDTVTGFPAWAIKSLNAHRSDEREYVYTLEQFEFSQTHDPLWNAAQTEMVNTGKMHGYMRMYWAKKILEWTPDPETAMRYAIVLNDRYELDGRDPNGYVGIAWSIGGVHDRPWFDRPVYGTVRYMSASGCKSKFDVERYIKTVSQGKLF